MIIDEFRLDRPHRTGWYAIDHWGIIPTSIQRQGLG